MTRMARQVITLLPPFPSPVAFAPILRRVAVVYVTVDPSRQRSGARFRGKALAKAERLPLGPIDGQQWLIARSRRPRGVIKEL